MIRSRMKSNCSDEFDDDSSRFLNKNHFMLQNHFSYCSEKNISSNENNKSIHSSNDESVTMNTDVPNHVCEPNLTEDTYKSSILSNCQQLSSVYYPLVSTTESVDYILPAAGSPQGIPISVELRNGNSLNIKESVSIDPCSAGSIVSNSLSTAKGSDCDSSLPCFSTHSYDKGDLTTLSSFRGRFFNGKERSWYIEIRKFQQDDAAAVQSICQSHFRSLCAPAVVFWVCQHAVDLVAMLLIIAFFVPLKELACAAVLFLLYLFCRAKWEMESYIRNDCPDLIDISATYLSSPRTNFWVAEHVGMPKRFGFFGHCNLIQNSIISNRSKSMLLRKCQPIRSTDKSYVSADKSHNRNDTSNFSGNIKNCSEEYNDTTNLTEDAALHNRSDMNCKDKDVDRKLVGCIGLVPHREDRNVAQLVRLVVSRESRRMRIGSHLLLHLENAARNIGYTEIRIYTNNLSTTPLQFVRQHGYVLLQVVRRGLMRGDLFVWRKFLCSQVDTTNDISTIISQNITSQYMSDVKHVCNNVGNK